MYRYGEIVRDIVTGYKGKVTGRADYYGRRPVQYLVESIDSTGRPIEEWLEENRVEPVHSNEEKKACCYIPSAELVEEIPLPSDKEELEKGLSAILNAKA